MLNLQICTVIIIYIYNNNIIIIYNNNNINRVGFFLSTNRENIRLFPSAFMRTYF